MKLAKKIIPVAVVLLFIGIAITPSINALPSQSEKERVLTIWMPGITENDYRTQIEVTPDQLKEVEEAMDDFLALAEEIINNDVKTENGFPITTEEWAEIKISVISIIDTIKSFVDDFPEVDINGLVDSIIIGLNPLNPLNWLLNRAPIFSVGRGWTWIPFYDYESFLGVMLRPIFMTHLPGFTAVIHFNLFPPRIEYKDRLGIYRARIMFFVGLFINFGDVGVDRIVGPVLLLGKGLNTLRADIP